MSAGRLVSVNVGLPQDIEWEGRTVHTGIWKRAVEGRRMVRRLNVDGDGQGDLVGHGGVNRAVFVYQLESYRFWEEFLGRDDFECGQFGENFTVEGLADAEVCIGDRFRIGTALLEVSQPRVTCFRVGIRMREPRMPALLVAHRRPGFYLRVLDEGEVEAGDEVTLVARDEQAMTVAEIDALLYLPGHARRDLERALQIAALSYGWKGSFRELLEQAPGAPTRPLAWTGMRPMRVTAIDRESTSVISIELTPADGKAAVPAQPGQFLTLRLQPDAGSAPLLRTYSLSGAPDAGAYRVSVKRELHGAASSYLHTALRVGDVVEAGAPRGSFLLRPGERPVVLIGAGVGATPLLAMLHVLAEQRSTRPVWWVHGARNGAEHSFATEVLGLLAELPDAHRLVCFSHPEPGDSGFDVAGRLTGSVLEAAGVPTDADVYVCGPGPFMHDLGAALVARGTAPEQIATERFGPDDAITPGIADAPATPPHAPAAHPARVR